MNFNEVGRSIKFKHLAAVTMLLGLMLVLTGCFETKVDTAPTTLTTGVIQGQLKDSVTLQPIVGASVSMGTYAATTDVNGQYIINNITVDASNNSTAAMYKVSIDTRSVTSPINMSTATSSRYPDLSYDFASVLFKTGSATTTSTTSTITYTVENVNFKLGKMAANITGVVASKAGLLAVGAGYTVKLTSLGSTAGPGGGKSENLVGSTLTDASGLFTFSNIEALKTFRIDAWNTDQTIKGTLNVTALAEGVTKTLAVSTNNAVLVEFTNTLAPIIISVTPEKNSDIAPAATDVIYTFSKPIQQTVNTNTSPSIATGLYNLVDVKFMGAKASNITHGLAWNSSFTQLTISIPALAVSSKYTVDLTPANDLFHDLNANALDNTVDKRVLDFTTNGAVTAAAPTTVTAVNSASLNYNSTTVLLDWLPVSGAKAYNVYRAQNFPSAAGQLQLLGTSPSTLTSDFSDTLPSAPFVSGQNKLTYSYVVKSVSTDNIESAASSAVTVQDNVVPTATIPATLAATYTITFSEPMDEISATNLSHYLITIGSAGAVPTPVSAVLNAGLTSVTLTLNASIVAGNAMAITGITDVAGNVMSGAIRTF
jgi:hypothetical protein